VTAVLVGAGRAPVGADSRTGVGGRTRILSGYDAGLPAASRPPAGAGGDLAAESAGAVAAAAAVSLEPVLPPPGNRRASRLAAVSRVPVVIGRRSCVDPVAVSLGGPAFQRCGELPHRATALIALAISGTSFS
jgi:hypothetical protein